MPWDWIDIGPDDQTLRIVFLEGVVHGLHHIEIDEDDETIQMNVFVGVDLDFDGAAALVGFGRWAMAKTDRPVASRRISDGSENQRLPWAVSYAFPQRDRRSDFGSRSDVE